MSSAATSVRFLSLADLADRLSTSKRTIREWAKNPTNPLPAYRVGGRLLFRLDEVVRWIETHRVIPQDIDEITESLMEELKHGEGCKE